MIVDGSAIVAILARGPECAALLARLEAAPPPYLTTPVALLAAVEGLARAKAPDGVATGPLLAAARAAVAEFAAALALREVPVTAELARRAQDLMVESGSGSERCLAEAAARTYRTTLLAVT